MHLLTGGKPAPWEYVELILCRDVYHCTPSQLAQENWGRVALHLEMLNIESSVRKHKDKAQRDRQEARSRGR